jgi:uncharacterized protein (DUF58 family)
MILLMNCCVKSHYLNQEALVMMSDGVIAKLPELIALQRYAQNVAYRPDGYAVRSGNHVSKVRGRGMDFSETRNYQAGDEIRHMEWRVTARTGRPHVKVYQEERERPVFILVDFNSSMYFGTRVAFKSVVAARLAAIIAWTAAKQGDRVGGFVFSETSHHEISPRTRRAGVLPLLAALSHYTQKKLPKTTSIAQNRSSTHALLRLRHVAKPGSIIVLISDFYHLDTESEHQLSRLAQHCDVLAYHVCDPLELSPPAPQQYAITDGHDDLLLDTTLDAVRFSYQFYAEQRITTLHNQCRRLAIPYMQLTQETDLSRLVRQTFPRKAHG